MANKPEDVIGKNQEVINEMQDVKGIKRLTNAIREGWRNNMEDLGDYMRTHGPIKGFFRAAIAVLGFAISVPIMAIRLSFAPVTYEDAKLEKEDKGEKTSKEQGDNSSKEKENTQEKEAETQKPNIDLSKAQLPEWLGMTITENGIESAHRLYEVSEELLQGDCQQFIRDFSGTYIAERGASKICQFADDGVWYDSGMSLPQGDGNAPFLKHYTKEEFVDIYNTDLFCAKVEASIFVGELRANNLGYINQDNTLAMPQFTYNDITFFVSKDLNSGEITITDEQGNTISYSNTEPQDMNQWILEHAGHEADYEALKEHIERSKEEFKEKTQEQTQQEFQTEQEPIINENGKENVFSDTEQEQQTQGKPADQLEEQESEKNEAETHETNENAEPAHEDEQPKTETASQPDKQQSTQSDNQSQEEYFRKAAELTVAKQKASIGLLQRTLRIGFNRAAHLMEQLEEAGIVGPEKGTRPRDVLMDKEGLDAYFKANGQEKAESVTPEQSASVDEFDEIQKMIDDNELDMSSIFGEEELPIGDTPVGETEETRNNNDTPVQNTDDFDFSGR